MPNYGRKSPRISITLEKDVYEKLMHVCSYADVKPSQFINETMKDYDFSIMWRVARAYRVRKGLDALENLM